MNRMNDITYTITKAGDLITTPDDLSTDAKVSLAYQCIKTALNSQKYWNAQAEQSDNDNDFNFCMARATEAQNAQSGLLTFLWHIANYVEAAVIIGDFEQSNISSDTGEVEDDLLVAERYSAKTHPYAWAQRNLMKSGLWPSKFEPNDDAPIIWFDLPRIADRIAGQTLGELCLAYLADESVDTRRFLRNIEIAGLSPTIAGAKKSKTIHKKLINLSKEHTPWIDGELVSKTEMMKSWDKLLEMDEDDKFRTKMKEEMQEIKNTSREAVRLAIRTATITAAITEGAAKMKAAGVSDAVIEQFVTAQMK